MMRKELLELNSVLDQMEGGDLENTHTYIYIVI